MSDFALAVILAIVTGVCPPLGALLIILIIISGR